jgi:hypothetical protein
MGIYLRKRENEIPSVNHSITNTEAQHTLIQINIKNSGNEK